eukprot:10217805-Heterocapsa_arctica.AAC.1
MFCTRTWDYLTPCCGQGSPRLLLHVQTQKQKSDAIINCVEVFLQSRQGPVRPTRCTKLATAIPNNN